MQATTESPFEKLPLKRVLRIGLPSTSIVIEFSPFNNSHGKIYRERRGINCCPLMELFILRVYLLLFFFGFFAFKWALGTIIILKIPGY
jgi:hypothetical protein